MSYSDKVYELLEKEKKKKKKQASASASDTSLDIAPVKSSASSPRYSLNRYTDALSTLNEIKLGKDDDEEEEEDIAPVKEAEDRKWFDSGAFEDGYQIGDITKTILGTGQDASENFFSGIIGMGEKVVDAGAYAIGGIGGLFGADKFADDMKDFVSKDLYDEKKVAKALTQFTVANALGGADDNSLLGDKSDSLVQSAGQLGAQIGLQAVGVPWYVTSGLTSFGGEVESAFDQGADYGEAGLSAVISAGAEILTEKISGGIKFGGKTLDDALVKQISRNISNKAVRTLAKLGLDAAGEGFEEVLSGVMSAIGQKITYADDKELSELFSGEDALESFIGGAVLGGGMGSVNAIKSNKDGVDYTSGMSANEEAVVNKEAEKRIAEEEKNGKQLTEKEKSKIYDEVEKDLDKGYISTDTIEEVLGGEAYKAYKDTVDSEESLRGEFDELRKVKTSESTMEQQDRYNELKQKVADLENSTTRGELKSKLEAETQKIAMNDRLGESYNEKARRRQTFTADVSKYDAKQAAVVQKAIDSGILNNTRRSHEFVDIVSKISADKGVLFDFTNNARLKESGFAVEGKQVNGYVTKDGITLNMDSPKAWQSTVGHEITHVLEGTDVYTELQNALFDYAKTKGDYQGRYDALTKLYANVKGADIDAELTADLVGDYLFSDENFVSNLSANHRNVFQKIYDEVKYLLKVVTAGSKEARQLEKVKYAFEKAYNEGEKARQSEEYSDAETKYSLREEAPPKNTGVAYKVFFVKDGKLYPPMVANPDGADTPMGVWLNADVGTTAPPSKTGRAQVKAGGKGTQGGSGSLAFRPGWHLGDLPRASQFDRVNPETGKKELFPENFVWAEVEYAKDIDYQEEAMSYGYTDKGKFRHAYAGLPRLPENGYYRYRTNPKPDTVPWVITGAMKVNRLLSDAEVNAILEKNGVPPVHRQGGDVGLDKFGFQEDGTVKYSISPEQQDFFANSKVRDEDGNLKVMYHGTSKGGHTVFDTYGSNYGLFGTGSYFTDSKAVAESYTKKGKGDSPQVYESYLNITNPIDMDAQADASAWQKAFPEASFPDSGTNEDFYRAMEEYFEDEQYARWEAAEIAMEALEGMGYDGITHIGGSRVNANGERHRVYIAFKPEQIKNVDNVRPTDNPDIRYSLSDSDGKRLSREQADYFKDSKMRDDNGNLKVMYHGTMHGGFHSFDPDYSDDGTSLFFVDSNEVASSYSGTSETYEARTFRTAEDFNAFFKEIGATDYSVKYENGWFDLFEDGVSVAQAETAKQLYEEFRDWTGLGEGEVNYKVYLNLKNPLEVDAHGKDWNALPSLAGDADQYNYIKILEVGNGTVKIEYSMNGDPAPIVEDVDLFKKFEYGLAETLSNMSPGEMLEGAEANPATTRDYSQYAKEHGYDGVIFKNIVDIGVYGSSVKASTVAIAFDSNQVKSVANEKPTGQDDIRYSVSDQDSDTYSKIHDMQIEVNQLRESIRKFESTAEFKSAMDRLSEAINNDNVESSIKAYQQWRKESGYDDLVNRRDSLQVQLENLRKEFDESIKNKALDEERAAIEKSGLGDTEYFRKQAVKEFGYAPFFYDAGYITQDGKMLNFSGEKGKHFGSRGQDHRAIGVIYANTEGTDALTRFVNDGNIRIMAESPGLDISAETEPTKEQYATIRKFIYEYADKGYFSVDLSGKDGRVVGTLEYENRINPSRIINDIKHFYATGEIREQSGVDRFLSISEDGEAPVTRGTPARDLLLETEQEAQDIAPTVTEAAPNVTEDIAPAAPVEADIPDDYAPISEADANALREEGFSALSDEDAPPETDAPFYGDEEAPAPTDPFEERDIKAVGNRKVKAYMYENPDVKPFFQEEANIMLGELRDTTKGEKWFNSDLYYETSGAEGWGGTTRSTSDDIAYLLDELGYTYAEIEKGLHAIIEDNGAENNAVSKRIEFLLNDRLGKGYTDFMSGIEIPPNQDYLNLLAEKEIIEYSEEARKKFFESAEQYAPVDEVAPVAQEVSEATEMPAEEEIAPTREYEAIRPQRPKVQKQTGEESGVQYGDRLVRRDSNNGRPGEKQRKWVGTSTESEPVKGKILPEDLNQDIIHYQPISNKKTLGNANAKLDGMGYDASVAYFNSQFAGKKVSLDDIALGERLIQEAVKRGDTKTAGELIQNVALLGTELGQKVQALSIIKRLTPEGQLGMLEKTIQRGKVKGDKAYEGVELTQEMIDKILAAYGKDGTYDQAKLNKAVEDVKQEIADQMKVTKLEKVNAWRYLSMLGNPKTHIRNLVSNVAMQGTVAVKNAVARTIESVAPITNRTKTWESASDVVKTYAEKTATEMKDVLMDGGKYNEDASIKEKRQIFKNKVLSGLYEFNSDMLSKEDWWFSRPAFKNALSEFLTANGIRTEEDIQNHPEVVEKAKVYATEQSQIATFRQYSWLANQISNIEHHNTATNVAVGAVLPFKKTPINIAKTGLNYSPLGFIKTIASDAPKVKNGTMEASELVDHLSQNIAGSALTLVGYMLAQAGFLSGGGEDDKEGEYDYQLGEQAYSINLGGKSYSLSWLSPVSMPLFVGANAYEQLVEGKEWNGDVVVETLSQTLDPLSEMSFLSGLNTVLSSYDSGGIVESMAQNYVTQFVPTLSSQVATVMDDTKRSTKVAGDSEFRFVDETINKLKLKIPFLRQTLEPSTDIWGNDVKLTDNILTKALETFVAPYAVRDNIATEIDAEIKALYSETGDNGIIPSIPYNYVNYKDEKYNMSASEYTAFKKTYGQTAYGLLSELFGTEMYQTASADDKADYVNKVYNYARDTAKKEFFAGRGVAFTNGTSDGNEVYKEDAIKGAIENDVSPEEFSFSMSYPEKYTFLKENGVSYSQYQSFDEDTKDAYNWAFNNPEGRVLAKAVASDFVTYRKYASDLYDIKADKDEDGKSISGSRKEKVIDYINNLDADYGEKIILFKSEYNADDTYNNDIIDYLNSREDISYSEMETILKKLGFTVKSDGTVLWD